MKFLLGAADPEMEAIEDLLDECGIPYEYATIAGRRVQPSTAYQIPRPPKAVGEFVLVECGFKDPWCSMATAVIDHHRPGDPGYGKGPEDFLAASSIGQVFLMVHRGHHFAGPGELVEHVCTCSMDDAWTAENYARDGTCGDDHIYPSEGWSLVNAQLGHINDVPPNIVLVAAADHCLGHAYRGRCPGVDPDRLMAWRVKSRATFQGRPEKDVLTDIAAARKILRDGGVPILPIFDCWGAGFAHEDGGVVEELEPILDFRDSPVTIPELPEAAAREGVAYCATMTERGGRRKVVVGSGSPGQIRAWMIWAVSVGLVDLYGDAMRGFAGGYQ